MPRTRAPGDRDTRGSLGVSATSLGVQLAGRRALEPHYVVDVFADQSMVTDLEFVRKADEPERSLHLLTLSDCPKRARSAPTTGAARRTRARKS
jgi:hypothetical protein